MTRKVNRNRSRRRHAHSLRLESLESRRLLAVAAFESELLTDNGGVPGAVIADNTITAGETFFLRVTAQEFDPTRYGLQSVGLDIEWDASLLDVVEEDFQLDTIITSNLPVLQKGSLDQEAGVIEGLSGTSLSALGSGRPIGNAVPETFVLIRMRAGDQPGTATLDLHKGNSKTITSPTASLGERHLRFDHETITIVAAANEPEVPVASDPETIDSNEPKTETVETAVSADEEQTDLETPLPQETEPTDVVVKSPAASEPVEKTAVPEVPVVSEPIETLAIEVPELVSPVIESPAVSSPVIPIESSETQPAVESPAEIVDSADPVENHADAVDAVLSFDFNGDGVFDLSDFGLINVQAASASAPVTVAVAASPEGSAEAESDEDATEAETVAFSHPCIAVPALDDVEATEKWLDDFATAWLADSEARALRREESQLF
ncbi:hypothetical protein [Aporhodopirellula aestuarii]|uniref:Uncharacterized protein n=1 Tax=Aporhodopirellula aestuarii TaxID=2950107 RepID=A0ABT0UCL4_9BACT|nr:hypothetical protein [Aporhodopirellula aestuarii]MCM2374215.1 hypothetical protein [Aporhodopirellula aestuarii]